MIKIIEKFFECEEKNCSNPCEETILKFNHGEDLKVKFCNAHLRELLKGIKIKGFGNKFVDPDNEENFIQEEIRFKESKVIK